MGSDFSNPLATTIDLMSLSDCVAATELKGSAFIYIYIVVSTKASIISVSVVLVTRAGVRTFPSWKPYVTSYIINYIAAC